MKGLEKLLKKIMPGMFEVSHFMKTPDDKYFYISYAFIRIAARDIEYNDSNPGHIHKIKKTNIHKYINGEQDLNNDDLVYLTAGFFLSMAYFNMVNELGINQNLKDIKEIQSHYVGHPYTPLKLPEKTTPFKEAFEVPFGFVKLIARQLTKK